MNCSEYNNSAEIGYSFVFQFFFKFYTDAGFNFILKFTEPNSAIKYL